MREQYPFFRDEDERTQAVIGEDAVDADLDGTYQKPYAVLTQKRLYCKNEQGNFITDASTLRSADKGLLPGQNWFLWAVVVSVSMVLALLCLWYWGLGGRWSAESIMNDAQMYIDNYHALEAKIPEYEQTIKSHEETQKKIEQLQQELESMDEAKIKEETDQVLREGERLKRLAEKAEEARDAQRETVRNIEGYIADYNKDIAEVEDKIQDTDIEENNAIAPEIESLRNTISNYERLRSLSNDLSYMRQFEALSSKPEPPGSIVTRRVVYVIDGQEFRGRNDVWTYYNQKIESAESRIEQLQSKYVDIDALQSQIEWDRQCIAESEATLLEQQKALEEAEKTVEAAQAEEKKYRPEVTSAEAKLKELKTLKGAIEQKQSVLNSIPLTAAQDGIQRFEHSGSDYKNAQSVQRKVKLFLPCLAVFALCVAAAIILTACRRTKTAVMMALASACVGLVCAFLSNMKGFALGYYYIMPRPLAIVLRILPVLAVALGVLALWRNRKQTVFNITHATGAFYFTPSLYPAEELKSFTAQVEGLRAENMAHV